MYILGIMEKKMETTIKGLWFRVSDKKAVCEGLFRASGAARGEQSQC